MDLQFKPYRSPRQLQKPAAPDPVGMHSVSIMESYHKSEGLRKRECRELLPTLTTGDFAYGHLHSVMFCSRGRGENCDGCSKYFDDSVQYEFGSKIYGYRFSGPGPLNFAICSRCYGNLSRPRDCRKCSMRFRSGNQLFRHLKFADHYV